jgi:hypothetical protein
VELPLRADWSYGVTLHVDSLDPRRTCVGCLGGRALAAALATPHHLDSAGRVVRSDPPQYSALYLKVIDGAADQRFTLILLANSDGVQWPSRFEEATIARSPFATVSLAAYVTPGAARP